VYSLNRKPDEGGAKYWADQIQGGAGFTATVDSFFNSLLASGTNNIYYDYQFATTGFRGVYVEPFTTNTSTDRFFIDTTYYPSYPGQSSPYNAYSIAPTSAPAYPYAAATTNYTTNFSYVPYYYQLRTDYQSYNVLHVPYYTPGNANYTPGNPATYNPPTYPIGTYNTVPGNASTYNPTTYPPATYNPITYPVATYNPVFYPVATYSPFVAGNPSSALGVTLPGGPGGNQPVPATGPTEISYYTYPDNAAYPVTVAPGGQVVIKTN
jgi:hypothetical protein